MLGLYCLWLISSSAKLRLLTPVLVGGVGVYPQAPSGVQDTSPLACIASHTPDIHRSGGSPFWIRLIFSL